MLTGDSTLLTVRHGDSIALPQHMLDELGVEDAEQVEVQVLDRRLLLCPVVEYTEGHIQKVQKLIDEADKDFEEGKLTAWKI